MNEEVLILVEVVIEKSCMLVVLDFITFCHQDIKTAENSGMSCGIKSSLISNNQSHMQHEAVQDNVRGPGVNTL